MFVDEAQVEALEQRMAERGYLEGRKMATVFNLMRSNDLIWPYVVNNYLKGKAPFPFDLLYWNSDATRMPAANHAFYVRSCYLENRLARGKMTISNTAIDLKSVKVPIYNLATREDHIAPPKSVLLGSKYFGGPVRFVLAGSGHIAGVVNPPDRNKYQYWTGPRPRSADLDKWLAKATEHPGSWWPDWLAWLKDQDATEVPAREPGGGALTPIEDAPGSLCEGARLRRSDLIVFRDYRTQIGEIDHRAQGDQQASQTENCNQKKPVFGLSRYYCSAFGLPRRLNAACQRSRRR